MANAERLREAIQVIRENQARWSQRSYVRGTVNPDAEHWSECGTTFCLAGWGCVLDGLRPEGEFDGLHRNLATGRFIASNGDLVYPQDHARSFFDLTWDESYTLFLYMTTDVEELSEVVERVIAGEYRDGLGEA